MTPQRQSSEALQDVFANSTFGTNKPPAKHSADSRTAPQPVTGQHCTTDSKPTGYVIKKITGSTNFKHSLEEKKTGLHSISIDTDNFNPGNNHSAHDAASIDTDQFLGQISGKNSSGPVIIDESDVYSTESSSAVQQQPALLRKTQPVQQRSISLDISSDISAHAMPSVERREALGSGIVEGVLGSGGMAKVYKVWNEKLELYRAVKVQLPTTQKEQLERFMTEAKISAKLHHPNIIETYDCGEWRGLPIIEMELVDGNPLNVLIGAHNALPSPVAASIAVQVAQALAYAHSQELLIYGKTYKGIIHRDLKPSNVMIAHSGRVKLMDFGVARPLETGLHTVVTDSIVGTIHYFSPEQIGGYPIDHLTDIYSFGAVLYELLCGNNPFPYSNMVSMIQAKTKNAFRRLEDCRLDMDLRLASIAQTCLRTDKRERFPSFARIVEVLSTIQSSYQMGTPDEVVAEFCKNPAKVSMEYEQFRAVELRQSQIAAAQAQPAEQPLETREPEAVPRQLDAKAVPSQWESKTASSTKKIWLMIAVLLLLVGATVALLNKTGNKHTLLPGFDKNALVQNITLKAHAVKEQVVP